MFQCSYMQDLRIISYDRILFPQRTAIREIMAKFFMFASLCLCSIFVDGQVTPRAIRLIGPAAYIGQVQIYNNNQWLSVCKDNWKQTNADVVCRQLGYQRAVSFRSFRYARYDGDSGDTIQGFDCAGNEARLDMCQLLAGNWTDQECGQDTAGVICQTPTAIIRPIRLVGGTSDNEGRVEIKHGGEWTTVCDTGWDQPDANIVCHQLGYRNAVRATSGASYGRGTGTILLSNVKCKEDDLRFRFDIRYCNVTNWYPGPDECTHANDAGVECDTGEPNLDVRLSGPDKDTVQIRYNEDWMSICDDNWNMQDALVVCRQLGYTSAKSAPATGYHGWQGYYLRNFLCTGNETRLDQCMKRGDWNLERCGNDRFAGVKCVGRKTTHVPRHSTVHIGGHNYQPKSSRASAIETVIVVFVVCGILLFIFSVYFIGHKARQRRKRKEPTLALDETETATISLDEREMNEIALGEIADNNDNHYVATSDDIPLVKEEDEE